ncbi:MAG: hypothetical protein M3R54_04980 [Chloroflexota bacterium]|nr:hypothetical protein [Chloroflexota bacterium]
MSFNSVTLSSPQQGALPVPGMTTTFTLTNPMTILYLETDGVIAEVGGALNDFVSVDVRLVVDGMPVAVRVYDIEMGKYLSRTSWSFALSMTMAAGPHTVSVEASLRGVSSPNGTTPTPTAVVGGNSTSPNHGTLNVLVLNK